MAESIETNTHQITSAAAALKYSELKVSAAEFKPLAFAPAAAATTGAEDLADDIVGLDLAASDDYYNEEDAYYDDSYSHVPTGQPLDRDAILAVLQQNFPEYSPNALEEMYISCGSSLPATIDVLYKLENELYGVQQQQQYQYQSNNIKKAEKVVEFNADDFPSLVGGSKDASSSSTSAVPFGANYAGRAKAAAHLPAPRQPQRNSALEGGSTTANGGSGSSAAAPAWQAQGIEKFSTGLSVAVEYAEARSEARDHARARNVCFENATQAYLRGDKALAKELGAKGRWHNERMKMLHAQAAEETFTKRNAASLANSTRSSGNYSSSGGGGSTPTIDLHGLHVSEAIIHLDRALENLQQKRVPKVRLVVGVGQHGKVPARLKAAVETHLSASWGLRYREPYQGLLEVDLT
jgi:DNA-nicking Smr family endonuclease